ncbi:MAG: MarR family transcriptional regulator [Pseudomonadota bacterium]|nr:MarR family transcriptional regulator [Pseudomonadota bacterium]
MSESPDTPAHPGLGRRQRLQWETLVAIGICEQLIGTRANQLLGPDLSLTPFSVLNHFVRLRQTETVTDLARAFQVPQPGMTKTVQKLLANGWLAAREDPADARRKLLDLTDAGIAAHGAALARLGPDAERVFADWSDDEIDDLRARLFRLKVWLDNNRHNIALPDSGDAES